MTEKEYRESPGISRSELWKLNPAAGGTPEKFKWARSVMGEPTPAMLFGTLVHMALLEPQRFFEEFTFAPDVDRRTKAGKEAWAAFEAARCGRTVVTEEDWAIASMMVQKVHEVPFGRKLLSGSHEVVYRWTDELTGEECKIRADAVVRVGGTPVIVDYKTTTDASDTGFAREAIKFGYDFQSGMYCEGFERATGEKPRFVFIAQEKQAPYSVNVLEADEEFIQWGKDIFRELIGLYHNCKLTDNWYGYMGENCAIGRLSLPAWLK